jgi:WD40 repeat protein
MLIVGKEASGQPPKVVSGSRDGSIRIWAFAPENGGTFVLEKNLLGHAREVTGLAPIGDNLLWSAGMDYALRIWDHTSPQGTCQHAITAGTKDGNVVPPTAGTNPAANPGHAGPVTGLLCFDAPNNGGTFVLSSSLDGTIQAWNGANGQCVANEDHGEGVVCMSMATDLKGNPLLLIGLESGNIMVRNILQAGNMPAFGLLFCLSSKYSGGHNGAVRSLCQGPSSTFYSCGNDGKLLVWQLTGDLL